MPPLVSVIIPAHNEEMHLLETINSILSQTYKNIEIIVVDDGSKDNTRSIALAAAKKHKNIRLIPFSKGHSAAFARNHGAKIARGEILIFQDADCYAEKTLVAHVVKDIAGGADGVASRTLNAPPKSIIGRAISAQRSLRWEVREEKKKQITAESGILVANMRKKCFQTLGGFDETIFYFEDADLTGRFFGNGYTAVYEPNAKEYHHDPGTLGETIKQSMSFGKGIAWLLRHGRGHKKIILPLYSLLALVLTTFSVIMPVLLAILIPLALLFIVLAVRSRDIAASLVFAGLFELRNLVKLYSIIVNLAR